MVVRGRSATPRERNVGIVLASARLALAASATVGIVVSVAVLDCGGSKQVDVPSCPPAPLDFNAFAFTGTGTCELAAPCKYAPPRSARQPDCNTFQCECENGRLSCSTTAMYCPCALSVCPREAKDGASCTLSAERDPPFQNGQCGRSQNALCAVPGPNADLDAGRVDGFVCACDNPGPVWRCVPAL